MLYFTDALGGIADDTLLSRDNICSFFIVASSRVKPFHTTFLPLVLKDVLQQRIVLTENIAILLQHGQIISCLFLLGRLIYRKWEGTSSNLYDGRTGQSDRLIPLLISTPLVLNWWASSSRSILMYPKFYFSLTRSLTCGLASHTCNSPQMWATLSDAWC